MRARSQEQSKSGVQIPRELISHLSLPTTFILILVMFPDKTYILKMDSSSLCSPSVCVCVCVCVGVCMCVHMHTHALISSSPPPSSLFTNCCFVVLSVNKPEAQNHMNSIFT